MSHDPPMNASDGQPPAGWPASRRWEGSGWLSTEQAQRTPGVRVTDSPYWGAWWAQALRGVLHVKRIRYHKVVHPPYQDDDPDAQAELLAWTAQTSVPTMVYDDGSGCGDVVRNEWLGQLMLAEEIAPEPSLVPTDVHDRVLMFGLAHEVMSPQGLMWNGRLAMSELHRDTEMTEKQRNFVGKGEFLGGKYAHNAKRRPPLKNIRECLRLLAVQLAKNEAAGSRFFVGAGLTALDIYWVHASNFVRILPPEDLPVMRFNRGMYPAINEALGPDAWPRLLAHRDYVLHTYLECPVSVD